MSGGVRFSRSLPNSAKERGLMISRWLQHYRPIVERSKLVQDTAKSILSVLNASSEPLTAKQIRRAINTYEFKVASYLGLLRHEQFVEAGKGAAGPHECSWIACRCNGYSITESGKRYLAKRSEN